MEKTGTHLGKYGTDMENIWVMSGSRMGTLPDQSEGSIGKV
ncbi:MAG: hypothetical protein ABIS36_20390 [Chryseolinea sp.]